MSSTKGTLFSKMRSSGEGPHDVSEMRGIVTGEKVAGGSVHGLIVRVAIGLGLCLHLLRCFSLLITSSNSSMVAKRMAVIIYVEYLPHVKLSKLP